jgi:hypothetical protein
MAFAESEKYELQIHLAEGVRALERQAILRFADVGYRDRL